MNLITWYYIGITIFILDVVWIFFYYCYAAVKIYNFCEGGYYQYLGYLWIGKKRGEWYLKIPKEMVENSVTTKYKIVSVFWFYKFKKGRKIHIDFAGAYRTEEKISTEILVQNYIATSGQL